MAAANKAIRDRISAKSPRRRAAMDGSSKSAVISAPVADKPLAYEKEPRRMTYRSRDFKGGAPRKLDRAALEAELQRLRKMPPTVARNAKLRKIRKKIEGLNARSPWRD